MIKGIDITCAFGSEFLTEEDGDIFVEFPEVLDQHFGDLLDEQLEEQQPILAEEERAKAGARPAGIRAVKVAGSRRVSSRMEDDAAGKPREAKNGRKRRWSQSQKQKSNERGFQGEKKRVRQARFNGKGRRRRYGRLRKSLYGLRRAAKLFNRGLNKLLIDNGYEQCPVDKCVYRKTSETGESILFNTHVDDFAVFPTCEAMFEDLLAVLKSK